MLGRLGHTPSILIRMVRTKSGGGLVGSEGPVDMAIGLLYGKKLETRSEIKTSRKKLFADQKEVKHVLNRRNGKESSRKKVIFKSNTPSKAFIQDKFPNGVYNGESAVPSHAKHQSKPTVNAECLGNGRRISPKRSSDNIYQKVFSQNFSKIRSRTKVQLPLNNVSYKISNVRIDLVRLKLSPAQLKSLKLSSLAKNNCLKNRRKISPGKKSGIPVLLIPHGSYSILDCVVRGKVSRIPHSLRYIKPSPTADNYGLGNKQDIEYDDEDCPRKAVPCWAQGDILDEALAEQEEFDITSLIFSVCDPPNLDLMFPQAAAKRDIWRTPPSSYSSRWGQRVEEVQGGAKEELVRYVTDRLENKDC